MELISVAALAENRVIGDDGGLPWEPLPADTRQYRETVTGNPVILGRRTFESFGEERPGSTQIVLSRTERDADGETVSFVTNRTHALEVAGEPDSKKAYVLGGEAIYRLFQPHLDRMRLSRIPGEYEGDVRYPDWDRADWRRVREQAYPGFTLEEWERR